MEDISQKINALLSSPDGMAKIQSAMAALGQATPDPDAASSTADDSDLSSLLSGLKLLQNDTSEASSSASTGPDLSRLVSLLPLLSGINQEDDNTALLKALRPHLHGEREKRVDSAIQMMKIMKVLPLISGMGKEP